jgi:hypothetical protein
VTGLAQEKTRTGEDKDKPPAVIADGRMNNQNWAAIQTMPTWEAKVEAFSSTINPPLPLSITFPHGLFVGVNVGPQ